MLAALAVLLVAGQLHAQDTTITYQGQLKRSGVPLTGTANLEFRLFDQLTDGAQVGPTRIRDNWPVEDGLFQAPLDFGPVFDGSARYLEIMVDGQRLLPRQRVSVAPSAIHADLASSVSPLSIGTSSLQNQAVATSKLADGAVTGSKINPMGASAGQFLRWSGSSWGPGVLPASPWSVASGNVFRSSGNVGINTSNPLARLHVEGIAYLGAGGSLRIGDTPSSNGWMLDTNGANTQIRLNRITSTGGIGNRMILDEQGRMSLGSPATSPGHMLQLFYDSTSSSAHIRLTEQGSDFARVRLTNTNANFNNRYWDIAGFIASGSDAAGDILNLFNSSGGDILTLRGSRRVGINRTNPLHPLQVGSNNSNGNGAHVTVGGAWVNGSSRSFKTGFRPVDPEDILHRLLDLEISVWSYTNESGSRHLGPMAEQFADLFGLGEDDRYISTVDAAGVALAAIQGLHERHVRETRQLREELASALAERDAALAELKAEIRRLDRRTDAFGLSGAEVPETLPTFGDSP